MYSVYEDAADERTPISGRRPGGRSAGRGEAGAVPRDRTGTRVRERGARAVPAWAGAADGASAPEVGACTGAV